MQPLPHEIRYTEVNDGFYLNAWLKDPSILEWLPCQEGREAEHMAMGWMGFLRLSAALTATVDDVPVGIGVLFLMPYQKVKHHCQFKVVIDPKYQKQGIGTSLIRNLKHLAQNYFHLEFITIEVVEGNPIIPTLIKQDFKQIFRQEKFFKVDKGFCAREMYMADLRKGTGA